MAIQQSATPEKYNALINSTVSVLTKIGNKNSTTEADDEHLSEDEDDNHVMVVSPR